MRSVVFSAVVPSDNVFEAACKPAGLPEAIYQPAVDQGYYAMLAPPRSGAHTLHIRAETTGGFGVDVVYELIVAVLPKNGLEKYRTAAGNMEH
jgi:hypothetical protein